MTTSARLAALERRLPSNQARGYRTTLLGVDDTIERDGVFRPGDYPGMPTEHFDSVEAFSAAYPDGEIIHHLILEYTPGRPVPRSWVAEWFGDDDR